MSNHQAPFRQGITEADVAWAIGRLVPGASRRVARHLATRWATMLRACGTLTVHAQADMLARFMRDHERRIRSLS